MRQAVDIQGFEISSAQQSVLESETWSVRGRVPERDAWCVTLHLRREKAVTKHYFPIL